MNEELKDLLSFSVYIYNLPKLFLKIPLKLPKQFTIIKKQFTGKQLYQSYETNKKFKQKLTATHGWRKPFINYYSVHVVIIAKK